jgi:hypothetical protein
MDVQNLIDIPTKNLSLPECRKNGNTNALTIEYFVSKGYKVYLSNAKGGYRSIFANSYPITREAELAKFETKDIFKLLPKELIYLIEKRTGCPDLLIYNPISKETFFVEIKKIGDLLKPEQFEWIKSALKYNIPVFILILSFDRDFEEIDINT